MEIERLTHKVSGHVCGPDCVAHYEEPVVMKNGKFFFFGCWNNRDDFLANQCNENVIHNILNSQELYKEQYDFGVILGDNIYPDENEYRSQKIKTPKKEKLEDPSPSKEKIKIKKFTNEKMIVGMKLVDQISVPLHIVLGNHDVENCKMLEMQMVSPVVTKSPIKQASTSSHDEPHHSQSSSDPETITVKNWSFRSNLYTTRYRFKKYIARLIVIDTNVISNYVPEISPETQTAKDYENLKINGCEAVRSDTMIINPKNYYDILKNMLLPVHNRDVNLIIIAGHEPLLCAKEKDTKVKQSVQLFLDDIMKDIHLLRSNGIETVYICADTHTFLDTTIIQRNNYFRQIVAGTGGASPDIYNDDFIAKLKTDPFFLYDKQTSIRTELIVNCIVNSYGYCSFDLEKFIEEHGITKSLGVDSVCVSGLPSLDGPPIERSIMYRHDSKNTHTTSCFKEKVKISKQSEQDVSAAASIQQSHAEDIVDLTTKLSVSQEKPMAKTQEDNHDQNNHNNESKPSTDSQLRGGGIRARTETSLHLKHPNTKNISDEYITNKMRYDFLKNSFNSIL